MFRSLMKFWSTQYQGDQVLWSQQCCTAKMVVLWWIRLCKSVISEEQYQSLGVKHKVLEVVHLRGAAKEDTMESKLNQGLVLVIGERSFQFDM